MIYPIKMHMIAGSGLKSIHLTVRQIPNIRTQISKNKYRKIGSSDTEAMRFCERRYLSLRLKRCWWPNIWGGRYDGLINVPARVESQILGHWVQRY